MTVTLPDEMRAALERKAAAGFASVDEYVADVLADDHDFPDPGAPHFRTRAELEKLLDEGMASGPPVPADDAFWARLDTRIRERAAKPRGTP